MLDAEITFLEHPPVHAMHVTGTPEAVDIGLHAHIVARQIGSLIEDVFRFARGRFRSCTGVGLIGERFHELIVEVTDDLDRIFSRRPALQGAFKAGVIGDGLHQRAADLGHVDQVFRRFASGQLQDLVERISYRLRDGRVPGADASASGAWLWPLPVSTTVVSLGVPELSCGFTVSAEALPAASPPSLSLSGYGWDWTRPARPGRTGWRSQRLGELRSPVQTGPCGHSLTSAPRIWICGTWAVP